MDDREAYEYYADPAHRAISGPGRKRQGQGQRLASMTSVRFAPEVIAAVRDIAFRQGITVGAWIRAAVARESGCQRRAWLDGHRHELEVIPGSGRAGRPRPVPSSLSPLRTFACPHMSIGNVTFAECGTCGPMAAAA